MAVEIKEVLSNADLITFIRYPLTLYKNNPYYVPSLFEDEVNTLRKDRNPAFATAKGRYWLAYRNGEVVGRVAALYVAGDELKWGNKYIRFGWLDFIDDAEVVRALMDQVEGWAKEMGLTGVHGPLGFTDMDREGMLVEGFDSIATLATNYNYPYYKTRMEELGYGKDVDWLEFMITMETEYEARIARAAELVAKKHNLHMYKGNKKGLLKLAPQIFDVIEEAYRELYGTVPLSKEQVDTYIKSYFGLAIIEFIPIVLDENDRVVAFGITFPSFSKALQKSQGKLLPFGFIHYLRAMKKNDVADLYLVGVRDEYRGLGLNAMCMNQIYQEFKKHGIRHVDTNLNLETNNDVQAMWKYFETKQVKRLRCFVKQLA
ncbi:MAG: GNAT family N-acetyltransferase [Anaerolineaceae bacterium]|nr:GNAT family N-acetyltransferase [Anaerolineaceae bacterium]